MKLLRLLLVTLLAFGLTGPSSAISPVFKQVLLLSGGCENGATVVLNFTTGQTCGPATLTVVRNTVGYANDSVGNWTQFAANTLRQTNLGALIEEARTNSIRNNSMQGAVAGSPGTLPTNWAVTAHGLVVNVIGTGQQLGVDYVDLQFVGTTTSSGNLQVFSEATNNTTASNGQVWAASAFVAIVGGDLTNVSAPTLELDTYTSGGVFSTKVGSTAITYTSALQRVSFAGTNSDASAAFERSLLTFTVANSVAVNFTLRIGWPQLELGAFATSPIRTTVAAVTRNQDIVSAPITIGSAVSVYFEAVSPPLNSTNTKSVGGVTDGVNSIANSAWGYFSTVSTSFVSARIINAGVGVDDGNIAIPVGNSFKTAFALANGDSQGATNGTLQTAGTQAFPVGMNTLMIGQVFGRPLDERVKVIKIWPNTRLPNGTLQSLTAP